MIFVLQAYRLGNKHAMEKFNSILNNSDSAAVSPGGTTQQQQQLYDQYNACIRDWQLAQDHVRAGYAKDDSASFTECRSTPHLPTTACRGPSARHADISPKNLDYGGPAYGLYQVSGPVSESMHAQ